jgi:hypothetical protein
MPGVTSAPGRQRVTRVTALLVALACVVVAGVAVKITDKIDNDVVRTIDVGQTARLNGGTVSVTKVQAGTMIDDGSDKVTTKGMFLAVRVRLAAPGEEQTVGAVGGLRLYTSDRTYRAFGANQILKAPAGYAVTADMLFEVDPQHIDDATLELFHSEIIHSIPQKVRVRLGIERRNAAAWTASARGRLLSVENSPQQEALP